MFFFFSSRRRHTRLQGDWSSDVCSSDLGCAAIPRAPMSLRARGRTAPPAAASYRPGDRGGPAPHAASGAEIGRASCREKSVDLGGRRIIKKKKKEDTVAQVDKQLDSIKR